MLATVENNIQKAAARDPEMQEYPIFYSIDQANGISLWCPPHMPKVDGTGCSMNFSIQSDALSITVKKGLALSFNSQQVLDQLKATDPNKTQDHQHFGSPFKNRIPLEVITTVSRRALNQINPGSAIFS